MFTPKVRELNKKIKDLEDQKAFFASAVMLCIDEQNMLDMEIEDYNARSIDIDLKLRDLRAELADTI